VPWYCLGDLLHGRSSIPVEQGPSILSVCWGSDQPELLQLFQLNPWKTHYSPWLLFLL
jgi:hypothetical protein